MSFPALPRVPSAGKMGCGEIPDFAQFMPFQELYKSHGRWTLNLRWVNEWQCVGFPCSLAKNWSPTEPRVWFLVLSFTLHHSNLTYLYHFHRPFTKMGIIIVAASQCVHSFNTYVLLTLCSVMFVALGTQRWTELTKIYPYVRTQHGIYVLAGEMVAQQLAQHFGPVAEPFLILGPTQN